MRCNFILYVQDQDESAGFYSAVLNQEPILHVPGMTEFRLGEESVLGLMPEEGIKRLLGDSLPSPATGALRAEVYLTVADPHLWTERAVAAGARLLSPVTPRNWGDEAGYVLDPDGNVLAFARKV